MNKNALLGIGAVVLILVIAGVMLSRNDAGQLQNQAQDSPQASVAATSDIPGAGGQKSIRDLLSLGVAQQCTFSEGMNKGTTYVSDGKVRSDFTTIAEGTSIPAHLIVRDNMSYFWTDASDAGFKTVIQEPTEASTSASISAERIDVDRKGDYVCSAWVASDSMFTPPSDITFTDMSELLFNLSTPK